MYRISPIHTLDSLTYSENSIDSVNNNFTEQSFDSDDFKNLNRNYISYYIFQIYNTFYFNFFSKRHKIVPI